MKSIDMTGRVFGELTVISMYSSTPRTGNGPYWKCKCSCGKDTVVFGSHLRQGHTKSCGCLWRGAKSHGLSYHHLYPVWIGMLGRCYNPNNSDYLNYGASGIKVCERWKDARNFMADMEPSWKEGLSLDRINNEGDYELSNCRWATSVEQNNNRRPFLIFKGVS